MNRTLPWGWIAFAALVLLLPGTLGRVLLDVLGGLTLLLILLPLLGGLLSFLAWQLVVRRLRTCQACGTTSLGVDVCPACGASLSDPSSADVPREIDASTATITVEAESVSVDERST
jgi:hypothetical protein